MSTILIILVCCLILFFLYQIFVIIRKIIDQRKADALAKAAAETEEDGTEMTNDLRSLRLPKDAVMVRNPLFDARSPEHKEEFDYEDFEETGTH